MNVVSLCSGVGMLDLGLEWAGMRTVQVCEIDPWCRGILGQRFPGAAVHDDVWTIEPVACDVVAAGFPCQPISVAGRREGVADERWLWPAVARCVRLARPRYVLLENVPGITSLGLGDVLRDLAALGFDADWTVLGAWEVGALHRRDRFWLVATSDADVIRVWDEQGGVFRAGWASSAVAWAHGPTRPVADTDEEREPQPGGVPDLGRRRTRDGRHTGVVADADGERRGPRVRDRADITPGTRHAFRAGGRTAPADSPRVGEREPADEAVAIATRRDAWPVTRGGSRREPEPGLGGAPDGLPARVDAHVRDVPLPARWLDGTWEDGVNRTTTETGNRARRLSALGNGVVPQCVELIGYRIRQLDGAA